ncbi:MAG: hypothetical protein HGA19_04385, partial [Oscillochloris sp.]|nr:hypothetical protein [Oscillochloris sp.]
PAPSPTEDIPTWLREAETTPPTPPMPAAPTAANDSVPEWLREVAAQPSREPDVPAQRNTPEDLPPWLSEASSDSNTSTSMPGTGDMNLPSWLRGVADEPLPSPTPTRPSKADETQSQTRRRMAANEDAEGDDFFKGTDLPGWLRSSEPEIPAASAEGQALDWLTRLGTADEAESESSLPPPVVAPVLAPARRIYQRSPEQLDAIALLSQLVRTPYPAPAIPVAPAPLPRWQRIGLDRVLYALLAIVLLVGLIVPQITGPFQTTLPSAPGVALLQQQLANLSEDDVVMVAYEWNAQRSAELRPLEQAITNQLIGQKAKLILLSTDLQGTMLSFELRGTLRAAGYNINPDGKVFGGRDYVLLGYRPGGELALRRLAQNLRAELRSDFEGRDATQGLLAMNIEGTPRVNTINDLSMVIVLADQPQDVQVWMEQVHTAAPNVPIAFLMPQEAEPMVQPYLQMHNVYHLAGLQGALALSALAPKTDSVTIAHSTGQQSLAVLTFVILLIGGGLGMALAHARRSRRGVA